MLANPYRIRFSGTSDGCGNDVFVCEKLRLYIYFRHEKPRGISGVF